MKASVHQLVAFALVAASAGWAHTPLRFDSVEFQSSPVVRWQSVSGAVYSVEWAASLTNNFVGIATNLVYPQGCHTDLLHRAESAGFYRLSAIGLRAVKHGICVIVDFADTHLENYTAGQPGAVTNETRLRSILDQMEAHWRWMSVGSEELKWDIVRIQLSQNLSPTAFPSWSAFRDAVVNKALEGVNLHDYDYDHDGKGDAMWAFVASNGYYYDYLTGGTSGNGGLPGVHNGSAIFVDHQDSTSVLGPHIGNFTHECGHCFGLPDLYGTYDNIYYLSSMSGSWGLIPNGRTAWDRYRMGWLMPTVVTQSTAGIVLYPAETNLQAILIPTARSREYFMIEYRRRPASGFGSAMPVAVDGLAIYHVDEYRWGNGNNSVLPQLLRLEKVSGRVETNESPVLTDFWYPENPTMTNAFRGIPYYNSNTVVCEVSNISRTIQGAMAFDVNVHDLSLPDSYTNLLVNADFELGTGALPNNWTTGSWQPSGTTFTWLANGGISNSHCVRIESTTSNDAYFQQAVSGLLPGQTYVLSGWIRMESNPGNYTDRGACLAINGTWTHSPFIFTAGDWTYTEVGFTADTSSVTVGARLGSWGGDIIGAARFDNLKLERY